MVWLAPHARNPQGRAAARGAVAAHQVLPRRACSVPGLASHVAPGTLRGALLLGAAPLPTRQCPTVQHPVIETAAAPVGYITESLRRKAAPLNTECSPYDIWVRPDAPQPVPYHEGLGMKGFGGARAQGSGEQRKRGEALCGARRGGPGGQRVRRAQLARRLVVGAALGPPSPAHVPAARGARLCEGSEELAQLAAVLGRFGVARIAEVVGLTPSWARVYLSGVSSCMQTVLPIWACQLWKARPSGLWGVLDSNLPDVWERASAVLYYQFSLYYEGVSLRVSLCVWMTPLGVLAVSPVALVAVLLRGTWVPNFMGWAHMTMAGSVRVSAGSPCISYACAGPSQLTPSSCSC